MKKLILFLCVVFPCSLYPITSANIGKMQKLKAEFERIKLALQKKETILGAKASYDQLVKQGIETVTAVKQIDSTVGETMEDDLKDLTVAIDLARMAVASQQQYEQRVAGYEKKIQELDISLAQTEEKVGAEKKEAENLRLLLTEEQKVTQAQRAQREKEVEDLKILSQTQKAELEEIKKKVESSSSLGLGGIEAFKDKVVQFGVKVAQTSKALKEVVEEGNASYEVWYYTLNIEYLGAIDAATLAGKLTAEEAKALRDAVKPSLGALCKSVLEKVINTPNQIVHTQINELNALCNTIIDTQGKDNWWKLLHSNAQTIRDMVNALIKFPIRDIKKRIRTIFQDKKLDLLMSQNTQYHELEEAITGSLSKLYTLLDYIRTLLFRLTNNPEQDKTSTQFKNESTVARALVKWHDKILEKNIIPLKTLFEGMGANVQWEKDLQTVYASIKVTLEAMKKIYPEIPKK